MSTDLRPSSVHYSAFQMEAFFLVMPFVRKCTFCKEFNVHGSVYHKNILIYIQQDATLHSLFYLETALRISGGTTTHHQERKQLYLQHLVFATPLLLPAAIAIYKYLLDFFLYELYYNAQIHEHQVVIIYFAAMVHTSQTFALF